MRPIQDLNRETHIGWEDQAMSSVSLLGTDLVRVAAERPLWVVFMAMIPLLILLRSGPRAEK